MKELRHLALFIGVCVLPSCDGGVSDWVNQTFEQGKTHQFDKKLVKKYLKSVRVYDEFNTVALFDILWLSNDIRTTYALLHSDMNGLSREASNAFLRRQLKANDHFLTFYVLSAHDIPLNMTPSLWNMYLKIDGKTYNPTEIKVVEINPEYRAIFGTVLNNHKRPYEVKFDRKDPDGNEIVPSSVKTISFNLSSALYYATVDFFVEEQVKSIMPQEESVQKVIDTKKEA